MLSVLCLIIFDTAGLACKGCPIWLWIAFSSLFDYIWHSKGVWEKYIYPVVNCFQFFVWLYLTQHTKASKTITGGCELLSVLCLIIFDTAIVPGLNDFKVLWIAFSSLFDYIWHSRLFVFIPKFSVVNCFQFFVWLYLTQQYLFYSLCKLRCELLSVLCLIIFDTAVVNFTCKWILLWIAFSSLFDYIWHSFLLVHH